MWRARFHSDNFCHDIWPIIYQIKITRKFQFKLDDYHYTRSQFQLDTITSNIYKKWLKMGNMSRGFRWNDFYHVIWPIIYQIKITRKFQFKLDGFHYTRSQFQLDTITSSIHKKLLKMGNVAPEIPVRRRLSRHVIYADRNMRKTQW